MIAPTDEQRRAGFEAMCAELRKDGVGVPECIHCPETATGLTPSNDEPGKVTLTCGPCGRRAAMRVVR